MKKQFLFLLIITIILINSCSSFKVADGNANIWNFYPTIGDVRLMNAWDCLDVLSDSLTKAKVEVKNRGVKLSYGNSKINDIRISSSCFVAEVSKNNKILDSINASTVVLVNDILVEEYNNGYFKSYYFNGNVFMSGRMKFNGDSYIQFPEGRWMMQSYDGMYVAVGTGKNSTKWFDYKIFKSEKLSSKIEIDKINAEHGFSLVDEGMSKIHIVDIYSKINSHLFDPN